jgi:hypothetical protein
MSCTTTIATVMLPPAPPRVRPRWPRFFVMLLVLWDIFQEAREMHNAARKRFPFADE